MKKKLVSLCAVLASFGLQTLMAGPSPEEIKDQLLVDCKYPDCQKTSVLGSAAVPLNYDVAKNPIAPENRFGRIESAKSLTVEVPNKPGQTIVYSFIPTVGDVANQELFIAFHNEKHKPGTPSAKGTTLSISLQYAGDQPQDWMEFDTLHLPKKRITFKPSVLTLKPDATVLVKNLQGKDDVFDLSKMKKRK